MDASAGERSTRSFALARADLSFDWRACDGASPAGLAPGPVPKSPGGLSDVSVEGASLCATVLRAAALGDDPPSCVGTWGVDAGVDHAGHACPGGGRGWLPRHTWQTCAMLHGESLHAVPLLKA